jgi:cytochrome c
MLTAAALLFALAQAPERPHDPFVFRSVLDGRPRIVTIALDDELWVAWDAATCGLYKAWAGGVELEGAPYTAAHGPRSTSVGRTWVQGYDDAVWEAFTREGPLGVEARWRGYRVLGGVVDLLYELVLADGRTVRIEERPQFLRPEDRFDQATREEAGFFEGDVGFLRTWRAEGLPDDVKLGVRLRTDGARAKHSNGLERERLVDRELESGERVTEVHSHLVLTAGRPNNHLLLFFEPRAAAGEGAAAPRAEER